MSKTVSSVVACGAGWDVGTSISDDECLSCEIYWTPVLSWVVFYDDDDDMTWASPVSVNDLALAREKWVIRSPDGRIFEPGSCEYENEGALIAEWRRVDGAIMARRNARKEG